MWCGIWKSTLISPMHCDGPLTSESYTEILSGPLADFLEDEASLRDLSRMCGTSMWCNRPQSCATIYIFGADIGHSNNRLRRSTRVVSVITPDLSPLDFFLWGFLKIKVYERESTSKYDLLNRMSRACKSVAPTMLQKLQAEFLSRVWYCISAEGSHFEHYLS
ncbi:uncharacterized protein TNCV_847021 [Trichonephila clavipes]|nr:uncharacterized protein TNCV_847021 [Trichonephila clavipes]